MMSYSYASSDIREIRDSIRRLDSTISRLENAITTFSNRIESINYNIQQLKKINSAIAMAEYEGLKNVSNVIQRKLKDLRDNYNDRMKSILDDYLDRLDDMIRGSFESIRGFLTDVNISYQNYTLAKELSKSKDRAIGALGKMVDPVIEYRLDLLFGKNVDGKYVIPYIEDKLLTHPIIGIYQSIKQFNEQRLKSKRFVEEYLIRFGFDTDKPVVFYFPIWILVYKDLSFNKVKYKIELPLRVYSVGVANDLDPFKLKFEGFMETKETSDLAKSFYKLIEEVFNNIDIIDYLKKNNLIKPMEQLELLYNSAIKLSEIDPLLFYIFNRFQMKKKELRIFKTKRRQRFISRFAEKFLPKSILSRIKKIV